jgi:hypothetical protein
MRVTFWRAWARAWGAVNDFSYDARLYGIERIRCLRDRPDAPPWWLAAGLLFVLALVLVGCVEASAWLTQ